MNMSPSTCPCKGPRWRGRMGMYKPLTWKPAWSVVNSWFHHSFLHVASDKQLTPSEPGSLCATWGTVFPFLLGLFCSSQIVTS